MCNWNTAEKTENERYLEYQLEEERRWRAEAEERYERERKEIFQRMRDSYQDSLREAATWKEALRNQKVLVCRESAREGREWLLGPSWYMGATFTEMKKACGRALEIWPDEESKVADEIKELEERIAELKDSVRFVVGQRLLNEKMWNSPGWNDVARTLLNPDEDCESWLHW